MAAAHDKKLKENRIELIVSFQEKLVSKLHDSFFRQAYIEPLMYSGFTDNGLNSLIEALLQDEELKSLVATIVDFGENKTEVKEDLLILLKKLIERFGKFAKGQGDDSYIG